MARRRAVRCVGLVSVAWGVTLLARGETLVSRLQGRGATPVERGAVVVLGSRHVLEGLLLVAVPEKVRPWWATVDAVHALSMAALAAVDPARRRPAAMSGTAAALLALATAQAAE